jgi:hypothetical protein
MIYFWTMSAATLSAADGRRRSRSRRCYDRGSFPPRD